MRITSGLLKGRRFEVPSVGVRPTKDQVREAIFSSLADRVAGSRVLDLYAGSGSMGLEAWSRGARDVAWVERDRCVMAQLKKNVDALCNDGERPTTCVQADAMEYVRRKDLEPYDIVFADPPYDRLGEGDVLERTLRRLSESRMVAADGIFIYEQSEQEEPVEWPGWRVLKDKKYGDTRVIYYAISDVVPRFHP